MARVVRKVDNTSHWINHYLADSVVCFVNTSPLNSDYPLDSVIQSSNNRAQIDRFSKGEMELTVREIMLSSSTVISGPMVSLSCSLLSAT